jgi:hypothetical protein
MSGRRWVRAVVGVVIAGVPVAVDEYGVARWVPGAADFMRDSMALFEQRGMNHAFWVWNTSWPPHQENDAMDYLHGPDPANYSNMDTSAMLDVIRANWSQNTVRPSTAGP